MKLKDTPHHYYVDEIEINVMSIAPSGQGVFIADGLRSGFQDDFKYLAHEQNEPDRYFYLVHL